jgi:hypothetical protein
VELTAKGSKAIEVAGKQRTERYQALFEAIKVTGEEKEILARVCNRAIGFFDKHLGLERSTRQPNG